MAYCGLVLAILGQEGGGPICLFPSPHRTNGCLTALFVLKSKHVCSAS